MELLEYCGSNKVAGKKGYVGRGRYQYFIEDDIFDMGNAEKQ
jgi:hypothetical protein